MLVGRGKDIGSWNNNRIYTYYCMLNVASVAKQKTQDKLKGLLSRFLCLHSFFSSPSLIAFVFSRRFLLIPFQQLGVTFL